MLTTLIMMDVPLRTDEHGKIRARDTRVLLELVIYAFNQGETAEGIVDSYPFLALADVDAVLGYYLKHRAEVDAYVQPADDAVDRVQRETEINLLAGNVGVASALAPVQDEQQCHSLMIRFLADENFNGKVSSRDRRTASAARLTQFKSARTRSTTYGA